MCVRKFDVHVSCSSHVDAQFAAFIIDPRAERYTVQGLEYGCGLAASSSDTSDSLLFYMMRRRASATEVTPGRSP